MSASSLLRTVRRALLPALSGLLAGAAGLSVAQLIAQFIEPNSSPVIAVGGAAIDATPTPLKEYAIRNFGTNDKHVLLTGILAVLAVLTMAIGIAAARRFIAGVVLVVALGVVAVTAELRRPNATAAYPLPTSIGLACALGLLYLLIRFRPHSVQTAAHNLTDDAAATSGVPDGPSGITVGSRRQFLITGAGVGAAAAVALAISNVVTSSKSTAAARSKIKLPKAADPAKPLPEGVDLKVPGLSSFVTPNAKFYRVDTALSTPQVNPVTWKLKINGMVDKPFTLSYDDILSMPLVERDITMTCVSNEVGGPYVGTARWLGIPLKTLMNRAGINPEADQLFATSADGFTTSTPTRIALDGRDAMVVVGMNGEPLPIAHGFPARMIVPGLYGYVSGCKWLTSITAATYAGKKAYWTQRKWDINGPIYTESRIDVPASFAQVKAGIVPIAGVAWAQHRGVDKVEISIDGGGWQSTTLAATPGIDTWRQWWFKWEARPGSHQIRVRATDSSGEPQTDRRQGTFPRGATGIQEALVTVS
jgi:DMSO/TMAO reductase YedYZ molybdopterin-dependent catalytic subunit